MFEKNYYTLRGVADELNIGESTIQYWQDQYPSWIPYKDNEKEKWYPRQAIGILRFIIESADSGMTERDIEKELLRRYPMAQESKPHDVPLGDKMSGKQIMPGDSVSGVLKGLLEGLSRQQMRIADAQERRAAAEERKATAMEKRAEAQKLMADALNNVALALKHTSLPGSGDMEKNEFSYRREAMLEPVENLQVPAAEEEEGGDHEMQARVVNSLLDDLSDLIASSSEETTADLDDLSELLEEPEAVSASEMDDLSDLIASSPEEAAADLDDLTELVEDTAADAISATESNLDDLSELIESREDAPVPAIDDLSALLESPAKEADRKSDAPLAAMETVSAKPDATGKAKQAQAAPAGPTKKIPGDYTSKIIALIIQLKEKKGMGIDAVTEYMNTKGYKTISGKEKWDSNTITQIFDHIKRVRSESD